MIWFYLVLVIYAKCQKTLIYLHVLLFELYITYQTIKWAFSREVFHFLPLVPTICICFGTWHFSYTYILTHHSIYALLAPQRSLLCSLVLVITFSTHGFNGDPANWSSISFPRFDNRQISSHLNFFTSVLGFWRAPIMGLQTKDLFYPKYWSCHWTFV